MNEHAQNAGTTGEPAATAGLYGRARMGAMLAVSLSVMMALLDYAIANGAQSGKAHD